MLCGCLHEFRACDNAAVPTMREKFFSLAAGRFSGHNAAAATLNAWNNMNAIRLLLAGSLFFAGMMLSAHASETRIELDGWTSASPREEIRPAFEFKKDGGSAGRG